MILELLLDALLDSVKMLPFLFAAYWLIEYVEHRHSEGIEKALAGGGRFGFVPGAVLGLLPQCGFSAMAANLYASKVVTLGTLLAVFLATSDEAVPLLIANPEHWRSLALILGIKLAVALAAGFCIDFVFKRLIPQSVRGGYTGSSSAVDCHEHEERDGILAAALKHTLHIFLFILLFNIALGALVALVGEEAIGAFLAASGRGSLCWPGLWGSFPTVCPRSSSPSCMPRASFRWEAWWRGCARAQAWGWRCCCAPTKTPNRICLSWRCCTASAWRRAWFAACLHSKIKKHPAARRGAFCAVRARDRERPCAIQFPPIAE